MFVELWDYLTTKSDKRTRKLGYLYQSVALKHRAKRCLSQWKPHILSCRSEVERAMVEAIKKYPQRKSVAVLGSADMNEVPLALLEKYFSEIYLVDVVHSKEMRMLAKENPKLNLVVRDLSGLPDDPDKMQPSEAVVMPELFDVPPALVISANLLSQIHRVPCQYFEKKGWAEEDIVHLAYKIQKAHLQGLKKLDAHVLLYSDYRLEYLNSKDQVLEVQETVSEDLLPRFQRRWLWDLAPIPEHSAETSLRLRVFSTTMLKDQ